MLTSAITADRLGVSERSARTALGALATRSIVAPLDLRTPTVGRPRQWWTAPELLDLVGDWSS